MKATGWLLFVLGALVLCNGNVRCAVKKTLGV
jgi:hypothetical protein